MLNGVSATLRKVENPASVSPVVVVVGDRKRGRGCFASGDPLVFGWSFRPSPLLRGVARGPHGVREAPGIDYRRTSRRPNDDPCLSSLVAVDGPRSASSRSAIRSAVLTTAGNTSAVSSNLARRRLIAAANWYSSWGLFYPRATGRRPECHERVPYIRFSWSGSTTCGTREDLGPVVVRSRNALHWVYAPAYVIPSSRGSSRAC